MARADLLKKLFSSFKNDDRELFFKIAGEIIEDERKKNHGILANDLSRLWDEESAASTDFLCGLLHDAARTDERISTDSVSKCERCSV